MTLSACSREKALIGTSPTRGNTYSSKRPRVVRVGLLAAHVVGESSAEGTVEPVGGHALDRGLRGARGARRARRAHLAGPKAGRKAKRVPKAVRVGPRGLLEEGHHELRGLAFEVRAHRSENGAPLFGLGTRRRGEAHRSAVPCELDPQVERAASLSRISPVLGRGTARLLPPPCGSSCSASRAPRPPGSRARSPLRRRSHRGRASRGSGSRPPARLAGPSPWRAVRRSRRCARSSRRESGSSVDAGSWPWSRGPRVGVGGEGPLPMLRAFARGVIHELGMLAGDSIQLGQRAPRSCQVDHAARAGHAAAPSSMRAT
jgi:hypothetical protein